MRQAILLLVVAGLGPQGMAWAVDTEEARPAPLAFEVHSGYFVSNKFEPKAAESFVAIADQAEFDKIFGVARVMRDKSHRLAKDAFKSKLVVAAIKRGKAFWTYSVQQVTLRGGVVRIRYTATAKKSESATFACPLIVSIPKGTYSAVQFVENKKAVKTVTVGKKSP